MTQKIKKIGLLITICLFLTGFLYLIARAVGQELITDTFSTDNPNSNPEYYVSSKTNLVVSGGQVMLEEEPLPCGGTRIAGYCWYSGADSQSCDTVCSTRGGVFGGNCDWVDDPSDYSTCLTFFPLAIGIGPAYYGPGLVWDDFCVYHFDGYNNCSFSDPDLKRICACNQ